MFLSRILAATGVISVLICQWLSLGMFNPVLTPLSSLGWLILLFCCFKNISLSDFKENWIFGASGVLFLLMAAHPSLLYVKTNELSAIRAYDLLRGILAGLGFACIAGLFFDKKYQKEVLFWSVGFYIMAQWLVLRASPFPVIDVFVNASLAADYFLAGKNPYAQMYPDIYGGAYGKEYPTSYGYWPAYLLVSLVPRVLGDVRLLNIFCFLLIAILYFVDQKSDNRKKLRPEFLFLFFAIPNSFFVNEQAWIDIPLVVFLFILATFFRKPGFLVPGVLAGLIIAYKQYAFVAVFLIFISWFRLFGSKEIFLRLFASGLTFLIFLLPFASTDWTAFFDSTISGYIKALPRPDSSNIPNILKYYFQAELPGAIWVLISLGGLLLFSWKQFTENNTTQKLLLNISLSYSVVFLLGKQAFANYFYLCISLLILSNATSEIDVKTPK